MKLNQFPLFRFPHWLMSHPGRLVFPVLVPVAVVTHLHRIGLNPLERDVLGVIAALAFGVALGRHFHHRLLRHGRGFSSVVWPIPVGMLATVGVAGVLVPPIAHIPFWKIAGVCGFLVLAITYAYRCVFEPSGRERGWAAEDQVAAILEKVVQRHPNEYCLLNGLLLQDAKYSSEIDHVLFSPAGAYVIETKGYRHVFIDTEGTWFSGQGEHPVRIADPVVQNRGHVKAVKAILGNDIPCASLVVLTTARENLRGHPPKPVVLAEDLEELIEVLHAPSGGRFSPKQVAALGRRLQAADRTDPDTWGEHLRRIRARQAAAIARFS